MLKKIVVVVMLSIMLTSVADARIFGKRRANKGGGGTDTFPPGTPTATVQAPLPQNQCVGPTCPVPTPVTQMSVQKNTFAQTTIVAPNKLRIAEAKMAALEDALAKAEMEVVLERQALQRQAKKDLIQLQAQQQEAKLDFENTLQDLQAQMQSTASIAGVSLTATPAQPTESEAE